MDNYFVIRYREIGDVDCQKAVFTTLRALIEFVRENRRDWTAYRAYKEIELDL